ncbi:MAG: hypothetical protein WDO18_00110 [Acidobacteriota bacterium]
MEQRAAFFDDGFAIQSGAGQLRVSFVGADAGARATGFRPIAGRANFLLGSDPAQWRQDVSVFAGIEYRDLYPGITARYVGGRSLKSEFHVSPGADPAAIRLAYGGAEVRIEEEGALLVTAQGVALRELAPDVYVQGPGDSRVAVPCRYRLFPDGTVGFEVGSYDTRRPLVIDPAITYATYLGGQRDGCCNGRGTGRIGQPLCRGMDGVD